MDGMCKYVVSGKILTAIAFKLLHILNDVCVLNMFFIIGLFVFENISCFIILKN